MGLRVKVRGKGRHTQQLLRLCWHIRPAMSAQFTDMGYSEADLEQPPIRGICRDGQIISCTDRRHGEVRCCIKSGGGVWIIMDSPVVSAELRWGSLWVEVVLMKGRGVGHL
jgi:hypothetical protein